MIMILGDHTFVCNNYVLSCVLTITLNVGISIFRPSIIGDIYFHVLLALGEYKIMYKQTKTKSLKLSLVIMKL